jgi:multidrug transporter EmrE-like cation transporter
MSDGAETGREPNRGGVVGGFLNPYAQIGVGAVLVAASELMLKVGATQSAASRDGLPGWLRVLGVGALASGWTWLGIICYVLSFASWLYVLRRLPLGLAFALINVVHVLVPIGARVFLHEPIPMARWVGIALILAGIVLVAGPAAKAEEKL